MRDVCREQGHVGIVILGPVLDATTRLMRGARRRDGADGPGRGAAQRRVLLQQDDPGPGLGSFYGRGQPRSASADDDHIGRVAPGDHRAAAAWPALVPAMRPKTEPDMSPVPPG